MCKRELQMQTNIVVLLVLMYERANDICNNLSLSSNCSTTIPTDPIIFLVRSPFIKMIIKITEFGMNF